MYCVGCGIKIVDFSNRGGNRSYTCKCHSTAFASGDNSQVFFADSIARQIINKDPQSHLDDIVGVSDHISERKQTLIIELIMLGFTWMKDCTDCIENGTYNRRLECEAQWRERGPK